MDKSKRLKKELTLFSIYSIATGATLSSGLFLLPGLAYQQAGPAMIVAYLLAALPMIPGIFAKVELSTAMPRSGGVYYFLDRSMGPMVGTIGGLGVYLVMILKSAFALVGIGAYLQLFYPDLPLTPLAVGFALLFGAVNLLGAKKSGTLQAILVIGLLCILTLSGGFGLPRVQAEKFMNFFASGSDAILDTAALLCVSYIGLTKIASVAEEVENPERNLPLGVFLALVTALVTYAIAGVVITGVVDGAELSGNMTPAALAARGLFGEVGVLVITIAAVLAFSSVSNAGILSASRYPLAMGRDRLVPDIFQSLSKGGIPRQSIYLTVGIIVLLLVTLDPTKIAKLASAFQLLMFAMICVAVIVMRESKIESYDPGYSSPLYPWMHILGIIMPLWFISRLGWLAIAFSTGLVLVGLFWYLYYARARVSRGGAIFHMFARLGHHKYEGLDTELREILREKGLRKDDPFDNLIANARIIDLSSTTDFEEIVATAADILSSQIHLTQDEIREAFLQGTLVGATPVSHGAALPHIRLTNIEQPKMVIVRVHDGVKIKLAEEFWGPEVANRKNYALFFLASPEANPKQHLRLLAQIAERVDHESFIENWLAAVTEQDLKEILLADERFISLEVVPDSPTGVFMNKPLHSIQLVDGCLVALIHRGTNIIIPQGKTILEKGDRLTVLGNPGPIKKLQALYGPGYNNNKTPE